MKQFLLFFILIVGLLACKNNIETITQTNEFNQQVAYSIDKTTKKKEGAYIIKTADGVLVEESNYTADTLDGVRKLYNIDGKLETIETYKNGDFHGPTKTFYENGQIKFDGNYVDNILTGETKSYYQDGQLKEVVAFRDNLENGPFTEYHPNGKIKAKGTYLNGDSEHGELELFDENGELIKKMDCNKGVCRTIWTKEEGSVNTKNI